MQRALLAVLRIGRALLHPLSGAAALHGRHDARCTVIAVSFRHGLAHCRGHCLLPIEALEDEIGAGVFGAAALRPACGSLRCNRRLHVQCDSRVAGVTLLYSYLDFIKRFLFLARLFQIVGSVKSALELARRIGNVHKIRSTLAGGTLGAPARLTVGCLRVVEQR